MSLRQTPDTTRYSSAIPVLEHRYDISWTAEAMGNPVPPLSMSRTEMANVLSRYSSVMMCVEQVIT